MPGDVWDSRNHLASMDSGADTFQYDPFGRRLGKTTILGTTNYLYDAVNPVQELSGTTPTANMLTGLGVDEYFTRTDSSGTANFLTDALGSTLELADNGGNSLAQYTYEPFGNTTATGTSSNPYQYTGRENDGDGLYYYRARYFNPTLQRFISEDPAGIAGGINAYAYTADNPVGNDDPSGKYAYPYHVYITYEAALNVGYNSDDALALARAVADIDFAPGSQGTDATHTNIHAMSGRKDNGHMQTCQQAYGATQNQLVQDYNSGSFAQALHTIQDSTAPGHRGYQPWNGGYTPFHIPGIQHLVGDYAPPSQDVQQAIDLSTEFLQDVTVDYQNGYPLYPSNYLPQNPCGDN